MGSIRSFQPIVKSLVKLEKATGFGDKEAFNFFKKMTCGYGTDISPLTYKGQNLEELPDFLRSFTTQLNLKRPSVVVNGRSRQNGQGILGFKFMDGNRTVATSALGIDLTKGEPIVQFRSTVGQGTNRALSFNGTLNTNLSTNNAFYGDIQLDAKLLKEMGFSDDFIKNISKQKKTQNKNMLEEFSTQIKTLFKQKGIMLRNIDENLDEFAALAAKTGKVTKKSVKTDVTKILKKIGYDPKDIKLNINKFDNSTGGAFHPCTGELELNLNIIKNNQDLANILAHELTHMEDFIILNKRIGAKNFQKLCGNEPVNQKWYDKMTKRITTDRLSFEWKGKPSAIILADGTKITDPEILKTWKTGKKKFSLKAMQRELKLSSQQPQKYRGNWQKFKDAYDYHYSPLEQHARQTELQLKRKLELAGTFRHTSQSKNYGLMPDNISNQIFDTFKQIDTALGKRFKGKKIDKFNEIYSASIETLDSEIANLMKKLEDEKYLLATPNAKKDLIQQIENIINTKYGSFESFQLQTLTKMQEQIGLQPIERYKFFDQAEAIIDPEITALRKQMRSGLPKEISKETIEKKLKDLITQRYKHETFYYDRISLEAEKLRINAIKNATCNI